MTWESPEAMSLAPGAGTTPPGRGGGSSWGLADGVRVGESRATLAPLGGGERYEVYLAWDDRLGARVVLKLLRPHLVRDAAALAALRREAEVLAAVDHPAIVRGLSAILEGPRPHLVLEHVEGPSLGRLVKRHGVVPLDRLLPLGMTMAAALDALAARGFVHLDLKPTHLLAGAAPRLVGLGAARRIGTASGPGDPAGMDAYLAPELCPRDAAAACSTPAADVFALGAVLHHAVRGAAPFPRPRGAHGYVDLALRFPQLHTAPAPLPARLPEDFRALLGSMLARDPAARPTAGAVRAALEAVAQALPPPRRRGHPSSDRNVRMPKSAETIQERNASASASSSARQKPIP